MRLEKNGDDMRGVEMRWLIVHVYPWSFSWSWGLPFGNLIGTRCQQHSVVRGPTFHLFVLKPPIAYNYTYISVLGFAPDSDDHDDDK